MDVIVQEFSEYFGAWAFLILNSKKLISSQEAKWLATGCNDFMIQTFSDYSNPMENF